MVREKVERWIMRGRAGRRMWKNKNVGRGTKKGGCKECWEEMREGWEKGNRKMGTEEKGIFKRGINEEEELVEYE